MSLLRSREVPCMLRMQEIEATQLFMFNFMCMIYPCTINVRASDAFGLVYHCDRGIENMNITTLIEPFDCFVRLLRKRTRWNDTPWVWFNSDFIKKKLREKNCTWVWFLNSMRQENSSPYGWNGTFFHYTKSCWACWPPPTMSLEVEIDTVLPIIQLLLERSRSESPSLTSISRLNNRTLPIPHICLPGTNEIVS